MIICQICKEKSYNTNRTLSKHLKVVHNVKFEQYAKENRIWPKCKNVNCNNFTKTLFNLYCSTKCRSNDEEYRNKMSKTKKEKWANNEYTNWTDKKIRTLEVEEKMLKRNEKLSETIQQLASNGEWGHESWNKGLTREIDERLARIGDKNSKNMKDLWKDDEYREIQTQKIIKAYESPELRKKVGKAVHDSMTPEIRKKISNGVCNAIINTNWLENVKNGYKTGFYDSKKSRNKTGSNSIYYKSSYERKAFIKLDYDNNVKRWLYEWIKIPVDDIRNTVPDFIVEYNDGSKKIIEVKPRNKKNDIDVVKKIKAIKKYCEGNNMKFELWIEDDLF